MRKRKIGTRSPFSGDTITIFDRSRVVLEGIERMISCQEEIMIVEKKGRIRIEGESLVLKELGNGNIAVQGRILSLHFEESGK